VHAYTAAKLKHTYDKASLLLDIHSCKSNLSYY
jgi:hypothetical protein